MYRNAANMNTDQVGREFLYSPCSCHCSIFVSFVSFVVITNSLRKYMFSQLLISRIEQIGDEITICYCGKQEG